eukprot:TRINITY_DN59029_c0_g1_i1.p2 TRINITY_DN59029_c0_g1~~TRINITY_DN59029_c0_g1_i1.p2  ORF type:complete len:194 (-),score=23.85 TRINITY_DN59029_c0_g1_i1:321-902(-)
MYDGDEISQFDIDKVLSRSGEPGPAWMARMKETFSVPLRWTPYQELLARLHAWVEAEERKAVEHDRAVHLWAADKPRDESGVVNAPAFVPNWTVASVRLGDIRFSQDTARIYFADKRFGTVYDLIERFCKVDEPEMVLRNNLIEVVPQSLGAGVPSLFSMDNRRLFALKSAYSPDKHIQVYLYTDRQSYDAHH